MFLDTVSMQTLQLHATEIERFLGKIRSLPNELKKCRIYTSNESCGNCELARGATGGEFGRYVRYSNLKKTVH